MATTHDDCQGGVLLALAGALEDAGIDSPNAHGMTIPDTRRTGLPAFICSAGEETEGGFGGTNLRDDWVFPVLVGLYTSDPSDDPPGGLTLTEFRELVRQTFHNRRLNGVTVVMTCSVRSSGPLADDNVPAFRELRTAMVVDCVARVARGG